MDNDAIDQINEIDDSILEIMVPFKMSLREALQIAVLCVDFEGPNNKCGQVYQRILSRLQNLPVKIQPQFDRVMSAIDTACGPEWPTTLD